MNKKQTREWEAAIADRVRRENPGMDEAWLWNKILLEIGLGAIHSKGRRPSQKPPNSPNMSAPETG